MVATRELERIGQAVVTVAWNTDTREVTVIYRDAEGVGLVSGAGRADSLPEAVALVREALGL